MAKKNSKEEPRGKTSSRKSTSPKKPRKTPGPPKKKFPPFTPPAIKVEPENIFIRKKEDGPMEVVVRPGFAAVGCVYEPEDMKANIARLIFEFIELQINGKEPDLAMFVAGAATKIGKVTVQYEDEALQEALIKYSKMAADYFTEHLVRVLAELPDLLIMQGLNATLAVMRKDGFLVFKEGSGITEVWDSFNKAMAKKVKRDWKAPKQGVPGYWNEGTRAEALEIYDSVHGPLIEAYPNRKTIDGEKEWIRTIMELGGYDSETAQYQKASAPGELALEITGRRLDVVDEISKEGEAYLYFQLTIARAERKGSKEAS